MTDYTKLEAYPKLTLIRGSGSTYEQGFCVMQAVSWFAGEEHTDAPKCACPVLGAYAIRLNDLLPTAKRQILRTLIAPLTSTRSKEHEMPRAMYIVQRSARDIVAPMFDAKWPEHAAAIRKAETIIEIRDAMRAARGDAYADAYASAYAYAYASADADAYADAYADASAYADAYAYADAEKNRVQDVMIDILRGAIALGPNGGEELTPFAERISELQARGYVAA